MNRTLRALLLNGAFIAALFAVIAAGDRLGGKWELLFPAYIVALLVGLLLYRRRRGWPASTRQGSSLTASRVLLVVVAVVTGLLLGGPTLALIAGLSATLGVLLAVGMQRTSRR